MALRSVDVRVGGVQTTIPAGTWAESAVFMGVPGARPPRSAFGGTYPDALMPRRIGRIPDVHESVILPDGAAASPAVASQDAAQAPGHALPAMSARVAPRMPACADYVTVVLPRGASGMARAVDPFIDEPDDLGLDDHAAGLPVLVLASERVDVPAESVLELLALLESSGLDAAVPLSNVGQPICLPVGKSEPRSTARPMPGGRSPAAIAGALRVLPLQTVPGAPDRVCAALMTPQAFRRWCAGDALDLVATCLSAYAWQPVGAAVHLDIPAMTQAPSVSQAFVAERARAAIAEASPSALPVAFVCDGVGPVGGTQVILNLCDALNDTGRFSASVVHKFTGNYPHRFESKAAPLPMQRAEMIGALPDRLGWRPGAPGIVVATSWGTGDTVRDIIARHPGLTPVAFWQDREDRFERHDGKPAGAGEFAPYLAIRDRIAVSRWVLDSADDEGISRAVEGAVRAVVCPAVDHAFTVEPPPERAPLDGRPVRILAMWRPMTAVRRGMPRLSALYSALADVYKAKRGPRVSLEVFGWDDGVPAGVRSHGHLSTSQVAALMREVDIVVDASEFQGFGLPGLEAIACGAAPVTTPCLGPDEYVDPGVNAVVAASHDGLFDAVRSLVDDPARLAAVQAGARATRLDTWADVAHDFGDAFDAVVSSR